MRSETGLVLILIVIMLSLSSLASLHFLEKQIVLAKVLGRLKQQAWDRLAAENDLLEKESRILSHTAPSIERVGMFVPDHLGFGCTEGQKIIEVSSGLFQSFVGMRYATSVDQWSPHFKLFFDHPVMDSPYSRVLKPQTQWDPLHSKLLDWVGVPPGSDSVVAVSNTGIQHQSLLYVLDGQQGRELAHQGLGRSLSRAWITQTALLYQGYLRKVLLLMAEDAVDRRVHLWVFDRSAPMDGLREMIHQILPMEYSCCGALKPIAIKNTDGSSMILLSLCKGTQGVLLCLAPETQHRSSILLRGGVLRSLTAVDQLGRGLCDSLYMTNAEGLWRLSLGSDTQHLQKLSAVSVDKMIVLPHPHRMGLLLCFLGVHSDRRGLYCLEVFEENLRKTPSWIGEPRLVLQGNFVEFWIRSGRVVLVSDSFIEQPLIWDIPTQRLIALHWKTVFAHGGQGRILGAQLVWDPKDYDEKIIVFDAAGKMKVLTTSLHVDQQGRLAVRRIGVLDKLISGL